jgi:hypothetical protein
MLYAAYMSGKGTVKAKSVKDDHHSRTDAASPVNRFSGVEQGRSRVRNLQVVFY